MGLFKAFKAFKEIAASGTTDSHAPHGTGELMMGFGNAMAGLMAPMLTMMAPERGHPLAATEPEALLPSSSSAALAAGQSAIGARDSAFDPTLLTTFADQVFAAVVGTYEGSDAGAARGVLADALWDPLAAAITMNHAAQRPGQPPGLFGFAAMQRGQATMAGAHAGDWYDTVNFSFDVTLGEAVPAEFRGPWKEEWLFQRSVQPGGDPMMLPDACPTCGVPTAVDGAGACTHCRQLVPVRTAGWLVSRIVTHNPFLEMQYNQMIDRFRQNPDEIQKMPEPLRALLPADLRPPVPNSL
jgi:hypothetical protein